MVHFQTNGPRPTMCCRRSASSNSGDDTFNNFQFAVAWW